MCELLDALTSMRNAGRMDHAEFDALVGKLAHGTPPPRITGLLTVDALVTMHWRALGSALHQLVLPALVVLVANDARLGFAISPVIGRGC